MRFAGKRKGHHSAPVKRVIERNDRWTFCVRARNLHGVLDSFRPLFTSNVSWQILPGASAFNFSATAM